MKYCKPVNRASTAFVFTGFSHNITQHIYSIKVTFPMYMVVYLPL